ncbi:hypothetical protein QUA67_13705 [Microcoleus sp. M2_C5]|uniref:hypothetical protein n=2 Tax=unclassified Microcoleus TaxID=2642155 RepID=UPI002FD788C0
MNKWLIRQIRPSTRNMAPQSAATLVRMIASRTKGAKTRQEALERVAKLVQDTALALRDRGLSQEHIVARIEIIVSFASNWIDLTFALLLASFSPAILLLICLASTLDSNLVPERRDFTFEEIKQSLLDRHWPPQRQRCDFVAASAY